MSTNFSNGSNANDRAKKLLPWAIAGIIALAGTNIATWVGMSNKKEQLTTTQTELKKEEDLNAQLEQQYKDAIAQLEEMKGKNTELNTLIDNQKAELTSQKERINGLINVKKDLNSARAELARMKASVQGYLDQIAQLEVKNKELTENVATLTTEISRRNKQRKKRSSPKNKP
jgi:DNA repair ATPase RecN